jgi:hypothetical protein
MSFYSAKNVASSGGDSVVAFFGMLSHGFRYYYSGLADLRGLLEGFYGSGRWTLHLYMYFSFSFCLLILAVAVA